MITIDSITAGHPTVDASFIGGGQSNVIDTAAGAPTSWGAIGGGQLNYIGPGTLHSSIFGGLNNQVTGSCSAILGGTGNSDAGFNNVFIAGSGISAVSGGTLHVNQLWANAIPLNPPVALPAGTVFAMAPGTVPPAWALPTTAMLWIA